MSNRPLLLLALFWASSVSAEVPMVESRSDRVQEVPLTSVPPADAVPAASGSRYSQLELLDQMELLQQEVQALRGQVERYQQQVSKLRDENRTRYLDLEQRIGRLQQQAEQAPSAPRIDAQALLENPALLDDPEVLKALDQLGGAPSTATAEPPSDSLTDDTAAAPDRGDQQRAPQPAGEPAGRMTPVALDDDPISAYEQARAPIAERNFPQAVANLRAYVDKFPDGERSGHAWYWLGEVYAAIPDLAAAQSAFERFLEQYPDHPKAQDASYKLAVVYHQQGDADTARKLLQRIVREHAGTSAAVLATNYLRAMVQ